MTRFPLRVLRTIRTHGLLHAGDRVLVALSGGADSTALLHVLIDLLPRLEASLSGVAHVHHGLRGAAADADLAWCRDVAAHLGLPFAARHVDVAGEALRRRWSLERTAHALRHAALRQVAAELGASRIALGHTQDDQAETVVLRLLRGAGTRGMGGMWPRRGLLVRPLIEVSRAQVEQFVAERGLFVRDDTSNADRAIPRNRVRHEVLPLLVRVAGAGLPARLARQAQGWRDEEAWLEAAAAPWVARVLARHGATGWRMALDALADAPPALAGRVRLAVARELLGLRVSGHAIERLTRLGHLRPGRRGRYGPWAVTRVGASLHIEPAPAGRPVAAPDGDAAVVGAVDFPIPGVAYLTALGRSIDAEVCHVVDGGAGHAPLSAGQRVVLDADQVGAHLVVRPWRAGDRLRPIGLGGSQKVQDLFVNRKVPRAQRLAVPVVAMPDGRVVWVVGLAADEAFATRATTTRVVILRATHPGGKA